MKLFFYSYKIFLSLYYTYILYKVNRTFIVLLLSLDNYTYFTLKNVFKYLYQQRGILAHGSLRSAMYVSNEDDLQIITIFINQICFIVCGNMQVYCMSSEDFKKKRLSERCEMLKSELKISME